MTVTVPKTALLLTKRTRTLYRIWWATHYLIGFIGVCAGALLTALTSSVLGTTQSPLLHYLQAYGWLIGILAAVCTSLVTFLGPAHKAERYWSAFHILDQACLEYECGDINLNRFLRRMKNARKVLLVADSDDRQSSDIVKDIRDEANAARNYEQTNQPTD